MVTFTRQTLGSNPTIQDLARVVNQTTGNLEQIFADDPVQKNSILLQGVSLASGSNQIQHTLGRKLTGWQVTRLRALATVHDAQDSQPLPSTYLTLVASAPVTIDLLVF